MFHCIPLKKCNENLKESDGQWSGVNVSIIEDYYCIIQYCFYVIKNKMSEELSDIFRQWKLSTKLNIAVVQDQMHEVLSENQTHL